MQKLVDRVGPSLALIASNVMRSLAYLLPALAIGWAAGVDALLMWMLFISVLSTQNLLMMGLPQVFIRAIASARNATRDADEGAPYEIRNGFQFTSCQLALREVQQVQTLFFAVFTLVITALLAVAWGLILARPAAAGGLVRDAAWAWGLITVLTPLRIEINRILALLHGLQDILVPRTWDAVFWTSAGLFGVMAALVTGSLFFTTLGFSAPLFAEHLILRKHLARRSQTLELPKSPRLWHWRAWPSRKRLRVYWAPTLRSGIGLILNNGGRIWVGVLFASQASPETGAAFLFALNLFGFVMMIGSTPLSAALPTMAAAYQLGDRARQIAVTLRATRAAMWLTAVTCLVILAGFAFLPALLPGDKQVNPMVWGFFSVGLLAQRLGAAHLQHYSLTNKIIWHWVDGATALGFLGAVLLFRPQAPEIFAVAVMLSHLLIYWPLAMIATRRQFPLARTWFDLRAAGGAVTFFGIGAAATIWLTQ